MQTYLDVKMMLQSHINTGLGFG